MRSLALRPPSIVSLFLCLIIGVTTVLLPQTVNADDVNDIDLRLFGDNVTQGWEGCRLGLWQSNRDPDHDRFAYVFFAPIPDAEELPGWVKLGDEVIEIARVDIGTADTGMLEPFRLYRSTDSSLTVMMEIMAQSRSGRGIEIGDGRLTFVENDKFPFAVRVKGLNGCPSAAADDVSLVPAGSGSRLTLGQPVDFDSLDQVPAPVMRAIAAQAPECAPETTAGYSSAYAINDEMTLWQIPCNLYASHGSSVFAVSWTFYPDHATVLLFPAPPGSGQPEYAGILGATVDPATASVTSVSLDSGGDCGVYEKFELHDAEGETVEFVLRELRRKQTCDGIESDPAAYPLIYENR
jgi:hypothetical protein